MAATIAQLEAFLSEFDDEATVFIGEGGLDLKIVEHPLVCYELGGEPNDDDDDDDDDKSD